MQSCTSCTAFFVTLISAGGDVGPGKEVKMADEDTGSQEQTVTETPTETPAPTTDWESEYKTLQAESQRAADELKQVRETLDLVSPYIDYSKIQESQQPETGEGDSVTRDDLKRFSGQVDSKLMQLDFRQKYPELRDYEDTLVGPAIQRLSRANPGMATSKLIDRAAKEAKEFLESERQKGLEAAEAKKKAAAESEGLGTAAGSTNKKEPPEGQTNEEYFAERQAELAKKRGY